MFYAKNKAKELSDKLFQNPTCEYRGTPFWAWNCKLEKEELLRQIGVLKEMGLGGFHMHVRSGMATPYLSPEFMELIRACCDEAERKKMLAWLYDEDRWPSGFAGGIVTKNPAYRIRYLLFTPFSYEQVAGSNFERNETARAARAGNGKELARFAVKLDEKGCLASYRKLKKGETSEDTVWYAYLEVSLPAPAFNGQTYVNTLDKKSIQAFIQSTHEAYKKEVGERFGKSVPAIFSDEPQFTHKTTLAFPESKQDVTIPWTDDLCDTFREKYHAELLEHLPELFWELPEGKISTVRYQYHDHVTDRFVEAFADQIGDWCGKNGIMMTGHVMEEPTLQSQTAAVGEAMRSYRSFQLPGIDMLVDKQELTTAKQCQSAAHQYGRPGTMSELYGVTTWNFDFRGYKLQGDWQAALGVTVRVPHLSWVSMEGQAKRDYPACINYQSPWYKEFSYIEDHFARLNTALTRGKPQVRVGVIHPIESFWLHYGPSAQTASARAQLDENFANLTNWLLYGNIDFDFISEALLPSQCEKGGAPLKVGEMSYDAVLVPSCETLRSTTLERLAAFKKKGGKLIFLGSVPKLLDAVPSEEPAALAQKSLVLPFYRCTLLDELCDVRDVELRNQNGLLTGNLLYQLRNDGKEKWLFVTKGKHPHNVDICEPQRVLIRVRGHYAPKFYQTLDGSVTPISCSFDGEWTVMERTFYAYDSMLFRLVPAEKPQNIPAEKSTETVRNFAVAPKVSYRLAEPNALVLDQAEYALDGDAYLATEELLRADAALRNRLGWERWGGTSTQPYAIPFEPSSHTVKLRFTVESELMVKNAALALERAAEAKIFLNGQAVSNETDGYYVDRSIRRVALPALQKGVNLLEIEYPFNKRTTLEWCYLLGNFGVRCEGRTCVICKKPATIGFRDITDQAMPFYSGALEYLLPIETAGGDIEVTVPHYRGTVIRAFLDKDSQIVAYPPYRVKFTGVPAGKHTVKLKLYVPRTNGFSPLHDANGVKERYQSPHAWLTNGDAWTYEYRTYEEGIISTPIIKEVK